MILFRVYILEPVIELGPDRLSHFEDLLQSNAVLSVVRSIVRPAVVVHSIGGIGDMPVLSSVWMFSIPHVLQSDAAAVNTAAENPAATTTSGCLRHLRLNRSVLDLTGELLRRKCKKIRGAETNDQNTEDCFHVGSGELILMAGTS